MQLYRFLMSISRVRPSAAAIKKLTKRNYGDSALQFSVDMPRTIDLAKEPLKHVIDVAIEALQSGGCIALPSDTVYGLVTLLPHMRRLYDIKHRDEDKPIGYYVHDASVIKRYAETKASQQILDQLLPGKLTLLFKRRIALSDETLNLSALAGFRVPDNSLIRELCRQLDQPLAQTSANVSGAPSSLTPEEFVDLWSQLDLIIVDSNRTLDKRRQGSTVIDLSVPDTYRIVREGCTLDHYIKILEANDLRQLS